MRLRSMLAAGALVLTLGRPVAAADPQDYSVRFDTTGNATMDATVRVSSQLESLRTVAPVGPFALIGRAQQDIERVRTALESFGYYRSRVQVTIEDRPLDDPELPDLLQRLPRDGTAAVAVHIDSGPLYHLRHITLEGTVDAPARAAFGLDSGAPAVASDVLAARQRLLDALEEEGHALARVDQPVAYEDASEPVLDVTLKVDAGPVSDIGPIRFEGLSRLHESFLRRLVQLRSGTLYRPSEIERARSDLLSLGVFSGITIRPPTATDAQGRVPIVFDVQERPRYAITLNAAYSSDLGATAGATWSDRNLFGNAEQLNLSAGVNGWGGTVATNFGYTAGAQLIKPDYLRRDQSLQLTLGALRQSLIAYDQTALTAGTSLNRQLSSVWKASGGVSVEAEQICQETYNQTYALLSLPLGIGYDSSHRASPLLDPTHGLIGSISLAPTEALPTSGASRCGAGRGSSSPTSFPRATYLALQTGLSAYLDFTQLGWSRPGRSVLALRGLVAQVFGAGQFTLPPDQRFYAGGSNTVRGYPYQSAGPLFSDGIPAGGVGLQAVGAEYRQRIARNFGAAIFIDAAEVSQNEQPKGKFFVGYGAGIRYYTPIGPIRLDLALPQKELPPPNKVPIEVYIGLGQAF